MSSKYKLRKIGQLMPGETFKREFGSHVYEVTGITDEASDGLHIYCRNLTNGNAYYWNGNESVIIIEQDETVTRKFYMCYIPGTSSPTYEHPVVESAHNEAERLAHKTGSKVYILEAREYVEFTPPVPLDTGFRWNKTK